MIKIITSFFLLAGSAGLLFGFVFPNYKEINKIKTETTRFKKALSKVEEVQIRKQELLSQYNLFAVDNLAKLDKLLPQHIDNVRLVFDMDKMATTHGIRITGVEVKGDDEKATAQGSVGFAGAEADVKQYQEKVLKFNTTATYQQFKNFMKDLERSLRIVDVVHIDVSSSQSMKKGNTATTALTLTNDGVMADADTGTDDLLVPGYEYKFNVEIKTYWLK